MGQCKSVVFDMDGVLFDSEALVIACWEEVAQKYAIPDIQKICRRCLGSNATASREMFLAYYGAEFPYDEYKREMSDRYWDAVRVGKLMLKPGVREILAALKQHGFLTAIASSTRRAVICEQVGQFGLLEQFDQIIGGDEVHHSKPHPEIYRKACDALGIAPETAYAVEDSYNGIRSAYAAGLHPILIPDLLPPDAEMQQLAEHIFPQMQAFQEFLFSK